MLLSFTADIALLVYSLVATVLTVTAFMKRRKEDVKHKEEYAKILHQKKSSEVRLGKMAENMAPFINAWPYDPNNFRFIGNPVDGISFERDAIHFIEIKTGKAKLSQSQKAAKQLVKEGKVYFTTFRVDEDTCTLKVEENE